MSRPTYQELLDVIKQVEEWATGDLEARSIDADHHPVVMSMREVIARDDEALARMAGGEAVR